jgi:RND family efflux transporter MFP subunit
MGSLAVAGACGGQGQAGPAQQGPPPALVTLATVKPGTVEDITEYVATLQSLRSTVVKPQVEGNITRIFVKSGDRVAEGAPLFQVDPALQEASIQSQDAERGARVADVAYARQQLTRLRDLFEQKVVSKQELDQAETNLATAEAALRSLDAKLSEEKVQLRYYLVTAPTAGVVGDVPVRPGTRVTKDTALTTLDLNSSLEVYIPVPQERAADLRPGLPVRLVDDAGEPLGETTITFISPRVDESTRSILAKGTVQNASGRLRSSQYVRARVVWSAREGLRVPVLSVVRLSGQSFVFVAEDSGGKLVARQRPVKLGPIHEDDYTILDGIKPGDRVVVSGVQKLADGAPIAAQT